METALLAFANHLLIQGNGSVRSCSKRKAGTAGTAVCKERELTDDQHFRTGFVRGEIHFAVLVFEDPQTTDFVRNSGGFFFRIVLVHTKENQQAFLNLPVYFAVNSDGSMVDSRNNSSQIFQFLSQKYIRDCTIKIKKTKGLGRAVQQCYNIFHNIFTL